MRVTRIRLQLAALLFILLPATAGVIAVRASATCERFVRTYVTKPVRNTVSKTTADAWAAWRVAHPNWKPNPNLHRPKYVMTRDEQVKKVDFACEVPTIPSDTALLFQTTEVEPPPPLVLPNMSTQTTFPALPTQTAEVTQLPTIATLEPPILVPVVYTGTPPPAPEPASLVLIASGLAGLLLLRWRRLQPAASE
jgi:hypothetical protein